MGRVIGCGIVSATNPAASGGGGITPVNCEVYHNTAVTINPNVTTYLPFNSETVKTDASMHSNTVLSSQIVVPVAGMYLIAARVVWEAQGVQFEIQLGFDRNRLTNFKSLALDERYMRLTSGGFYLNTHQTLVATKYLDANDTIEVRARQDNTGVPTTLIEDTDYSGSGELGSYFSVTRIA